ncbi:unnamed protein product [Lepeophtheirus salmonis]|uniref:(salmon louse) hypothetical protein n=1 Tax=Lepeophtheirus salmonis TaxID=72036 RepID=A0A7R8CNW0_LEPSM|nr:unnamed protein product [Lepeophtheirus salmonis]CAF2845033.1 unnamed protein product [Lepeophtheirus salmonis]
MRAVLDLTEGLRGHNVTCDNLFTSYQLGQQLLKRKITMVGTVQTGALVIVTIEKANPNYGLQSKQRRCGQSRQCNWSIQLQKDDFPLALAIFHKIIDVSSYNVFVIWREINLIWISHKSHKRRVFLEQLGKALVAPLIERRKNVPRTEASAQIVKAFQSARLPDRPDNQSSTSTFKASTRKRCQFCSKEKDNKTNKPCFKCNKYICKGCSLSYCSSCAQ